MKKVLITGSRGFVGQSVLRGLSDKYEVITLEQDLQDGAKGDITDRFFINKICQKHIPDFVIHCAGCVPKSRGENLTVDRLVEVNSVATINLAMEASRANPDVYFVFLSSISVYGECDQGKIIREDSALKPCTEYAKSKLEAENGLKKLFEDNLIKKLDVLRLAPMYDIGNTLNLEKRVLGLKKKIYLRYGSGEQLFSVLSRQNLIDFIGFRMEKSLDDHFFHIFNVADQSPCSFKGLIKDFQMSGEYPARYVMYIPLWSMRLLTRFAGLLLKNKKKLFDSYYHKLSNNMVFSNKRMLETGFIPKHSVQSVFSKANDVF